MSLDLLRPHDPQPRPSRLTRFLVVPLSMAAHLVAVVALVVIPLSAADVLPTPRDVLVMVRAAAPPSVPPAPAPSVPRIPARAAMTSVAPVTAPVEVGQETGLQVAPDDLLQHRHALTGVVPGAVDEGLAALMDRPPEAPRSAPAPLRIGGEVTAPLKVHDVRPSYPALAQQARVEGIVIIEATIGTAGAVEQARVLRSVPLLDEAALAAVRQWRFSPSRLNGVPVAVFLTVTVHFRLQGPED